MRYEHAGRFWTITRAGAVLTITSGKIGNKGRTSVKHHATDAAAIAAHDRLVLDKQREGFRLAANEPAAPAAPRAVPVDDARGPALEAAIAADPDDASAYAVYGDWLQRHGDPRGELIALQAQPGAKTAALAGKHVATHAAQLLGALAPLVPDLRSVDGPPFFWRHGFIRRAELKPPLADTLAQLFDLASAKFLVELALRAGDRSDALAALDVVRRAAPPTLRELDVFARADLGRIEDSLWTAVPKLERLTVTARSFDLVAIALPGLRRGRFLAARMSSAAVEAIAAAPWPLLERVELRFCGFRGACEADFHDLRPLLLRADMPALTHLRLRGCPFAGAAARALATSPLAHQLHVVDFSHGDFTPRDVAVLAEHASNFPNLRELWMPQEAITDALKPIAKHVLPDTRGPYDRLDDELADDDVVDRYDEIEE